MKPYHYAVVQFVFSPVGGEAVNVGVCLWSPSERLFKFRVSDRFKRLSEFFRDGFDGLGYRTLVHRLNGRLDEQGASLAQQPGLFPTPSSLAEVLRGAVKPGGCFRVSDVRGGLAEEPAVRFEELYAELVARHTEQAAHEERTDEQIACTVSDTFERHQLLPRLKSAVKLETPTVDRVFPFAWENGTLNVLDTLSFELRSDHGIRDKAIRWYGVMCNLAKVHGGMKATVVVAPPLDRGLISRYDQALQVVWDTGLVRELVPEAEVEKLLPPIQEDLAAHG